MQAAKREKKLPGGDLKSAFLLKDILIMSACQPANKVRKVFGRLLLLMPPCLLLTMQISFAGDAAQGEKLVRQWCSNCHVDDEAARGTDAAPSFTMLAKENEQTPGWVAAWLADPHPPMPNLNLSKPDIENIQAYLRRLSEEKGEESAGDNAMDHGHSDPRH